MTRPAAQRSANPFRALPSGLTSLFMTSYQEGASLAPLAGLTALKALTIAWCDAGGDNLRFVPATVTRLQLAVLRNEGMMFDIRSLPAAATSLTALRALTLEYPDAFESLANVPTGLTALSIITVEPCDGEEPWWERCVSRLPCLRRLAFADQRHLDCAALDTCDFAMLPPGFSRLVLSAGSGLDASTLAHIARGLARVDRGIIVDRHRMGNRFCSYTWCDGDDSDGDDEECQTAGELVGILQWMDCWDC